MEEPPGPPGWVRAADALAATFLVLGLFVLVFGGFALHLGVPFRVQSPAKLLFLFAAVAAIRHAAHPAFPLHRRAARALRAGTDASPIGIVRGALLSRAAVLAAGYLAAVTIGVAEPQEGFRVSGDPLLNLPARFDAGWYAGIALDGYYFEQRFDKQQNVAFFPAFPLLQRAAGYPLAAFAPGVPRERRMMRLLWAGVLVSIVAFAWASVYTWRLARDTIGEGRAPAAVALLSAYPFAIFFSVPYTESLFLLAAVAAVYHFRRHQLAAAAAWGVLAGLTRPNGCFLSIVLALLALERRWPVAGGPSPVAGSPLPVASSPLPVASSPLPVASSPLPVASSPLPVASSPLPVAGGPLPVSRFALPVPGFQFVVAAMPGIGMLIYSAYVKSLTGSWFGWARLHETWGRSFDGLGPLGKTIARIADSGVAGAIEAAPYDMFNLAGLVFALAMVWPVWRRLGPAYVAFVLVNVVPPAIAGGALSMGRITAPLFPLFFALAATAPPRIVTPLVTAFAIGQGIAAAVFFTWRPLF